MTSGKITIECGEYKAIIEVSKIDEEKNDIKITACPELETSTGEEAAFVSSNLWLFANFARG